jgi:pantetheine-phosphate adenylyltransferase
MTVRGIFTGSFDPITYGHLDIITRSLDLFKEVIVSIGINLHKKNLFSIDDRVALCQEVIKEELGNLADCVHVVSYEGLTVNLAKQFGSCSLVRGIRNSGDFEYEQNIASINKTIAPGLETVLLMANPNMTQISSSAVRELMHYSCDVSRFVPPAVIRAFKKKWTLP